MSGLFLPPLVYFSIPCYMTSCISWLCLLPGILLPPPWRRSWTCAFTTAWLGLALTILRAFHAVFASPSQDISCSIISIRTFSLLFLLHLRTSRSDVGASLWDFRCYPAGFSPKPSSCTHGLGSWLLLPRAYGWYCFLFGLVRSTVLQGSCPCLVSRESAGHSSLQCPGSPLVVLRPFLQLPFVSSSFFHLMTVCCSLWYWLGFYRNLQPLSSVSQNHLST